MSKIKIISKILFIMSISLFLFSISLFFLSFYTLVAFFFSNIEFLKNIQNIAEQKEITLYNPSLLDISEFVINFNVSVFNKTLNILDLNTNIPAKNEQKTFIKTLDNKLLENEIKEILLEIINEGNFEKIQKEINNVKLLGTLSMKIKDFLKIKLDFESNFSQIINFSEFENII